ncbi:MAG: ester cyclase [Thermodesulfobacteriota bacterium]
MVLETKKKIARQYIEELQNAKNLTVIDEVMTEDCVIHLGSRYVDKEKYKKIVDSNHRLFPDNHVEIREQIAEDNKVATQWKSSFTHTNELMGKEPTYEEITVAGTSIHKIIGNMIVEVWIYWDRQEIMEQLGIVPKYI